MSDKSGKDSTLSIPEILADFFLKKFDMSSDSEDSNHRHKSWKKKSKHKKHKHSKKSKNKHDSSDSTSKSCDLNSKDIVDDLSSSEEMGIKRLKKIKSMKLQPVNNGIIQSVTVSDDPNVNISGVSSSTASENLVYYGPSLELLLSGVESSSVSSKANIANAENIENNAQINSSNIENNMSNSSESNVVKEKTPDSHVILEAGINERVVEGTGGNNVISDNNLSTINKNDADSNCTLPDKNSSNAQAETCQKEVDVDKNSEVEKEKDPNLSVKSICMDGKAHSRSRSRSKSLNKHDSPKCKDRKRSSRSSSRESHKRRKRMSRSRSHSQRRFRGHEHQRSRSRNRSRSRSKKHRKNSRSFSPRRRFSRRRIKSRSRSHGRFKKRSYSRSRSRSLAKRKNRLHSRSRSKSRGKLKKKSHSRSRSKSHGKYKKHSLSRSRSKSQGKSKKNSHSRSRSKSPEKHKKNSHSRSRSRSHGRNKKHLPKRSRSRSRGRHKKLHGRSRSRSLGRRGRHLRSRSRSHSHQRYRKHSVSRERTHSRHNEGSSRDKDQSNSRKKSRSRSNSRSKQKSRSTSISKEPKSNKIDQAKILETARKNVLKMMKDGTLPEGLAVENIVKEQFASIQSGGKSVQELTDFCQRLSQKENEVESSDKEDKDDKPDDETGFIHHPFKVKEPGMIKLNIKNAVQLPIKTHAQKIAETTRLSSQFPVSSGNQHKQKELEWIPVVPETTKKETKPTVMTVATISEPAKTIPVETEPPVSSIPIPVSYPVVAPEPPAVENPSDAPALLPPPLPPPPPPMPSLLQAHLQPLSVYQAPIQPVEPSYIMPSHSVMNSYEPPPTIIATSTSVFKAPKKLDIPAIVAKRFQALTKLQENPNDPEALKTIHDAQESIQEWVESQQVPGLFTGSTDAKVLSAAELCGPFKYHKFRKDFLSHAPPVTEGKGMSLLKKMGWNPGEGLGKNKEGSLEPLMLDIKTDKKGLVSEGENSKKGVSSFTKELQGKHPVSALMELCSKRRWKPPLYTCVLDQGPSHRKHFCFKVEVNGVKYQPLNPSANKKVAKADAAVLCLQSLNVLPKTV